MKFKDLTNGKKTPIVLVLAMTTAVLGYGKLQGAVENNSKKVNDLEHMPAQMQQVQEQVKGIDGRLGRFETRQEKNNGKVHDKMDKMLSAIMQIGK